MNDDIKILGLAITYQMVCQDEFGEYKVIPKDITKWRWFKTFEKLRGILKEHGFRPEVYMRAIAKWVKRSKRFPTLYPNLLTGTTMLEVVKAHVRKLHLRHHRKGKATAKALRVTFRDEIMSEVRHTCEIIKRATKTYGFTREQVIQAFGSSLSPYWLLTEESYIDEVEELSEAHRKIEQRLARDAVLLDDILREKERHRS